MASKPHRMKYVTIKPIESYIYKDNFAITLQTHHLGPPPHRGDHRPTGGCPRGRDLSRGGVAIFDVRGSHQVKPASPRRSEDAGFDRSVEEGVRVSRRLYHS